MKPCYVLGLNYRPLGDHEIGHHPAAVLLRDGQIVAMVEEERFVRIKEAPGLFPLYAVQHCLERAGIGIADVAAIGWNWDPYTSSARNIARRGGVVRTVARAAQWSLRHTPAGHFSAWAPSGVLPENVIDKLRKQLVYWLGVDPQTPLMPFDHHLAHVASAYYASGFSRATVLTWDAWGDHLSGMVARAEGQDLEVLDVMPAERFSLGSLNDFVYAFLRTSEKGNLMGLAPYGNPSGLLDDLADPARLTMRMDLLDQTAPFPAAFTRKAGSPRRVGDPLEQRHKNLAADLQRMLEAFGMKIAAEAVRRAGSRDLCLAGGVALNATLNGKIGRSGLVDRLFVQPAAGDAGGALGAAYLAHRQLGREVPRQELTHVYWGPSFSTDQICEQLETSKLPYDVLPEHEIPDVVSDYLVQQKIVGWFQLGSEWGPRSLGARSIIADPRREDIRDRVNLAIKYRDWWRPFAPSILAEAAPEYLEGSFDAPFMILTFPVKDARRREIEGVIHMDGTTRPQMVHRAVNPIYYDTIASFGRRTGVPVILNTSFNLKGEPIVNSPRDAIRTFFASGMDVLIMGNVLVQKHKP